MHIADFCHVAPSLRNKYCQLGMVKERMLIQKGLQPSQAKLMANFANHGLAQSTWSSYSTVSNHLERCEKDTGRDLSLPFNTETTLVFVAWLLDVRKIKAVTVDKYLSALRMIHLTQGYDIPCLRDPIVKLILAGKKNWDNVRETLQGKVKRDPVTFEMMKFFKKKLLTISWGIRKKILFHSVTTLAWNGSFRIHELLSNDSKTFDPTVTLLWKDVKVDTVQMDGREVGVISIFLKSPKTDRIGAGQRVEVFETGNFMCPYRAFKKYEASLKFKPEKNQPVFREENGECLSGRKLSKYLDEISKELSEKGIKVKNHSFRAGVPTMMATLGYSDKDIMAAGRWQSNAFMAYAKLPRLQRAKFAVELAGKFNC